ncbi:leucine-rich repeat domain-containing protein [Pseudobacteriovorax antillogorgiicola]|uniref:Uncharacterized protein n=1 Tax=Pseudobacteriovorax antillogorgiicola TaxID=1513793 RepID=A0A1Y6C9R0_9BACT|nr:leucine-rich repeat domain-containing protein [Pseudobacteriovorax antillogorgiicola]TCS50789.1 hypothetical protein EDD56_112172 [Pseudobacteriovorax antillogorgiicola]SMF41527.1 hypothetical protein SAMN06296036_112171 [Pseudobacteriovorax antillogorgiicola]
MKSELYSAILLASSILLIGCQKLSNDYDELIAECGSVNTAGQDQLPHRLFDSMNKPIDLNHSEFIVFGRSGKRLSAISSPKGCLVADDYAYIMLPKSKEYITTESRQAVKDSTVPVLEIGNQVAALAPGNFISVVTSEAVLLEYCFQKASDDQSCIASEDVSLTLIERGPYTLSSPKEDGDYKLLVSGTDRAGNQMDLNYSFKVDSSKPKVQADFTLDYERIRFGSKEPYLVASGYRLGFVSASDPINDLTIEFCLFDSIESRDCSGDQRQVFGAESESIKLTEGSFLLTYRSNDLSGNVSDWQSDEILIKNQCLQSEIASRICTSIVEDLRIDDDFLASIDRLRFSTIFEISGALKINLTETISDLTFLESILHVGSIDISDNLGLTSLKGLDNIEKVDLDISLIANPVLADISSLNRIRQVLGEVVVIGNPELRDLTGLDNIVTISKDLFVMDNLQLTSMKGLTSLQSLGSLSVFNNENMTSLDGLLKIERVDSVNIEYNPSLHNLSSLARIEVLEGLRIIQNNRLVELDGLQKLNRVKGEASISYNLALEGISFPSLLDVEGLEISGNEVLQGLFGLSKLARVGEFSLKHNYKITRLLGLEALKEVSKLVIDTNLELEDLRGLSSLGKVKQLFLLRNRKMTSLRGLDALAEVGHLKIASSNLLEDFQVSNFTKVKLLDISSNPILKSFEGLESLSYIERVSISNNSELTSIDAIANALPLDGPNDLIDNPKLCGVAFLKLAKNEGNCLL